MNFEKYMKLDIYKRMYINHFVKILCKERYGNTLPDLNSEEIDELINTAYEMSKEK